MSNSKNSNVFLNCYFKYLIFLQLVVANKDYPFMLSSTDKVIGRIDYYRTTPPEANETLQDRIQLTSGQFSLFIRTLSSNNLLI